MAKLPVVFLVSGLLLGILLAIPAPARAANASFTLYGSSVQGWGNTSTSESTPGPTLLVHQGDSVTITLHSTDGFQHEFFIDMNANRMPDAGEPTSSPFTSSTSVPAFTASTAGTFTYYCYFHESAMHGTFIVQSSGTPSPNPSGSAGSSSMAIDPLVLGGILVAVIAVAGVTVFLIRKRR